MTSLSCPTEIEGFFQKTATKNWGQQCKQWRVSQNIFFRKEKCHPSTNVLGFVMCLRCFFVFYHGKSLSNHHLEEYCRWNCFQASYSQANPSMVSMHRGWKNPRWNPSIFGHFFWDPITPFVRIARDEFEVCQHRFVDVFSPQVFLVTCFVPPDLLSNSCGKQQRKNGHQWCWHPKPKEDAVGQHLPKSLELPQAKRGGKNVGEKRWQLIYLDWVIFTDCTMGFIMNPPFGIIFLNFFQTSSKQIQIEYSPLSLNSTEA